MTFYHEKEMNPHTPLHSSQHQLAWLKTHFFTQSLLLPNFLSVLLQRDSLIGNPNNTVCLNLLNRKTGESSYWSGLEPLFPVFDSDSDYFWETAALQWGSAVLGSLAQWLLLDTLHDGGCFPGVLHSSDHYQVSLLVGVHGESCQACNRLNALFSLIHYGFISTPAL